eukprot:gb/GFBE01058661.1/.p1 GENE.gb/GFBE01058661.1/~~gb/GFBE01058661.1/.p1  ORF type:complete len:133 (+),score=8.08 gb/GFBE01058661.1/:1-399(+)
MPLLCTNCLPCYTSKYADLRAACRNFHASHGSSVESSHNRSNSYSEAWQATRGTVLEMNMPVLLEGTRALALHSIWNQLVASAEKPKPPLQSSGDGMAGDNAAWYFHKEITLPGGSQSSDLHCTASAAGNRH